jgi:muramoyltetrapeptide carboxypeptidase
MAGLATLAALTTAPKGASGQGAIPSRKPARLKAGDVVGLIEPASASDEIFDIQLVEETMIAMGLKPKRAPHLLNRFGYLAGQDKDRASDVNAMFADPEVKAIFAVRGGWGCQRILPYLDFAMIRRNPKLLMGYSDITALHMAIAAKAGFTTIHSPNGGSAWGRASLESFRAVAFDGALVSYKNPIPTEDRLVQNKLRTQTIRPGVARGRLLGGNLTVLTSLAGTPYMPDFKGAILFLEDVDEAQYRIDRMLTQLGQAGVLGKLAGVAFGQCTDCSPMKGGSLFTLTDILNQHIAPLGIPAYQGAYFGHISNQFSIPQGVTAEIDATAGSIRLLEAAVA